MTPTAGQAREHRCHARELLAPDDGARPWPEGEVVLASSTEADGTRYVLALPDAVLDGDALTSFLDRVAPFGCPVPGSLIRAYTMPDNPFPSVLQREHVDAPDGLGGCYERFLAESRRTWLAALGQAGPGLYPLIAWHAGPKRRFASVEEGVETLGRSRVTSPGVADTYLGRGLLLLAQPALAGPWPTMMSLGGVTKARKITGREFPLWVDLPAHQPALLASPVLARAEELLAG
jgi:hypothetical protein